MTEYRRPDGYTISTDRSRLDRAALWRFLRTTLVRTAVEHPDLRDLRILLATADAQGLYERFGFGSVNPGRVLERPRRRPRGER